MAPKSVQLDFASFSPYHDPWKQVCDRVGWGFPRRRGKSELQRTGCRVTPGGPVIL